MEFMLWYSLFSILAWYQQEHFDGYNGSSENFYVLLSVYCFFNYIFKFVVLVLGFKTIGWWFLLLMIVGPMIMQALLIAVASLLFDGYIWFKLSLAGLLLIPLSVQQIISWKWSLLYIIPLVVYLMLVVICMLKRKRRWF